MSKSTYILADNQDLTRLGILRLIELQSMQSVVEVFTKNELHECLESSSEAVIVIDSESFDWSGLDALAIIAQQFLRTKWLFVVELITEQWVHQVNQLIPTANILIKSATQEEVQAALIATQQGKKYYCSEALDIMLGNKPKQAQVESKKNSLLTATEREIVQLLAQGKSTKEIANFRNLSTHTVITHRKNIFRKLEVNTIHELTKYALKSGLADFTEYYI